MIFRSLYTALTLLILGVIARAAESPLAPYERVVVEPAKSSIYIGSVTLSLSPATRQNAAYECTYAAKVFPYFFMSETGQLHLDAPDETLRRLARGDTVTFTGSGLSSDGEKRRFEGQAIPADAMSGRLKVRCFVSKRISLSFDMSYRFVPAGN